MNSGYRKIAVASTFSPRFTQVLAEAKRICDRFSAELHAIYVGAKEETTEQKFREVFAQLGVQSTPVHYREGDPAAVILELSKEAAIDLVIAGALEKEVVLRPFLGNVARSLVRAARSSVMLFTKPEQEPRQIRRIVMMAHYTDAGRAALKKVLHLAAAEQCERLYVIRVHTSFDRARAERGEGSGRRTAGEEELALEEFVDSAGETEVPIEIRCLTGTTGFAALEFLQSIEADLLAVSIDPALPPGELPKRIAWITDTIPCNLWVIR
ncbi:MAG: universal stress protein [Chthoniobacterales bacterium]|jgi:nucleotide-binding universal stress UspA family protein